MSSFTDIELIKSAKKYIKQRIVTNLNVPTYSTQFNYYGGYEIRLKQIYDKYIRYNQIKMFLKFIDLISLKDFDYMFYTSNFDRELNLYIRCLASHKDFGDLDIGAYTLLLNHKSIITNLYIFFEIEMKLFSNNKFYIIINLRKYKDKDELTRQYRLIILKNLKTTIIIY